MYSFESKFFEKIENDISLSDLLSSDWKELSETLSWKNSIDILILDLLKDTSYIFKHLKEDPSLDINFNIYNWFYWDYWESIKDTDDWKKLQSWYDNFLLKAKELDDYLVKNDIDEYLDFGNWMFAWFAWWIWVWMIADALWYKEDWIAEAIVRRVSWNWDTIWWFLQRFKMSIKNKNFKMDWLNTYALSSFLASSVAWPFLHFISYITGWNSDLLKALYTSSYSNADNVIGTFSVWIQKIKSKWFKVWSQEVWEQPFQRANIVVIIALFLINLLFYRMSDDVLDTQTKVAIHGVLLNLDSIFATIYLRYYVAKQYKKFLNDL